MESTKTKRHLSLRTSPSPFYRNVVLVLRVVAGILAGTSLAMFVKVVFFVFDERFAAVKPGLSALPAVALGITILWNIAALATIWRVKPFWHSIGDVVASLLLVALGSTGFIHDDRQYLRNGRWRQYDNPGWLVTEITGAIFMIVVFLIQLMLVLITAFTLRTESSEVYGQQESGFVHVKKEETPKENLSRFSVDGGSVVSSKFSFVSIGKDAVAQHRAEKRTKLDLSS